MKILSKAVLLSLLLFGQITLAQRYEIKQLQKQLPTITDSVLKTDKLNRLAQLMAAWHPDSGYYYLSQARTLAVRMNYRKGIADAYKTYGLLLTGEDGYLAATYLNGALERYRSLKDKQGEAMTLMNLANLMYTDQDSTNAYSYLMQSYKVASTLRKDSVLSIIINNIILHSSDFLSPSCDSMLKRGSAIAKKYNDGRMILYFKLFGFYQQWYKGEKLKANQLILASLKSADSIGNEYVKLSIYLQLGFRAPDTLTAIKYFKKGLDEATTYNFSMFKELLATCLYYNYTGIHNDKEANKYAAVLLELQNKNTEELRKYGFSIVNYVKKDQDLKLTQEKASNRTLLLVVFIFLSLTTIGLLFFAYRSSRITAKYAGVEKKMAKEIKARNQELENWSKFNDMLLSVLAHDLRQPFSSIIMTSQLLKLTNKALSEDELQLIVHDLHDTASKSVDLMEGILLWVQSKKDDFEYKTQPLLLEDSVNEANGMYEYDQKNKDIKFLNEIPESLIVDAHKHMLLFINRNLISNATKYSPTSGTIRVYSKIIGDEIIVGFEDQGPGMTPEQVNKLFKVYGLVNSDVTKLTGAGVALSLCYDMVQQMSGRIWVETAPGKGSTFFYALPQAADQKVL